MKMKNFRVVRPEIEVIIQRPILGRLYLLYLLFFLLKFFRVVKVNCMLGDKTLAVYRVFCIPKIKVADAL